MGFKEALKEQRNMNYTGLKDHILSQRYLRIWIPTHHFWRGNAWRTVWKASKYVQGLKGINSILLGLQNQGSIWIGLVFQCCQSLQREYFYNSRRCKWGIRESMFFMCRRQLIYMVAVGHLPGRNNSGEPRSCFAYVHRHSQGHLVLFYKETSADSHNVLE